jgi:hypothetical protein
MFSITAFSDDKTSLLAIDSIFMFLSKMQQNIGKSQQKKKYI